MSYIDLELPDKYTSTVGLQSGRGGALIIPTYLVGKIFISLDFLDLKFLIIYHCIYFVLHFVMQAIVTHLINNNKTRYLLWAKSSLKSSV